MEKFNENPAIRPYRASDEAEVIELWNKCGLVVPWNDPTTDIRTKIDFQPNLLFVGTVDGKIVASAMCGYDCHRGYVYYLAVEPDYQKSGIGRLIMEHCEDELKIIGCPKIDIMIRTSNLGVKEFYEKIGYKKDDVICMGKRLDGRTGPDV